MSGKKNKKYRQIVKRQLKKELYSYLKSLQSGGFKQRLNYAIIILFKKEIPKSIK